MKAIQITIQGNVQHVGFRYRAYRTAYELGIKGIVMNLPDGSVFIEAEGDEADLEQFLEWCRQGPRLARVDFIESKPIPERGFTEFSIE